MRAAFLGSPSAAVPCLAALLDVADVTVVVTQPDRPKGRSGRPTPNPVKQAAQDWGLPIAQPASHTELARAIGQAEVDVGLVVAYGRLLKPNVLALPRVGFVNVHFSLLPRWRGAAPVERALLAGDELTGVSLMQLDEGLDTGPIISVMETAITDDETGGSLTARLSYLGALLVSEALPSYMAGSLHPAEQISAGATYAARLHADEGRLDPQDPAALLQRKVRAFHPRPGAWLMVGDERIKVLAAELGEIAVPPGTITDRGGVPVLGTSDGSLMITRLQPPGKRALTGVDWMNGRRGRPATVASAGAPD